MPYSKQPIYSYQTIATDENTTSSFPLIHW